MGVLYREVTNMLDPGQLAVLQEYGYKALAMFDSFCRENGIPYCLRGGSALGAMKYRGFVPWDDDIDVALPRDDYRRLIEQYPKEKEDFLFISFQSCDKAFCYFPRIVLREAKSRKLGLPVNHEYGTLLIDILPIDGVPDNPALLKIQKGAISVLRLLSSVWTLDSSRIPCKRRGLKKMIPECMYVMNIHHLYRQEDIFRKMDSLYERSKFGQTRFAGILAGSKGLSDILPSKWWSSGQRLPFGSL